MTADAIIAALCIPAEARVDQRVPKKLLVDNGAPTAGDKRQINDGIEELLWIAALKPATIGVPAFRDGFREYLEIAVLSLSARAGAKAPRLTELIHRAIPYPVFLIQSQPGVVMLSLAHNRWSQGQSGQTVLEGPVVTVRLDALTAVPDVFLTSLNVTSQPRRDLFAFYQGWVERFEAQAAARLTGNFTPLQDTMSSDRRRAALAEHERLTREMAGLRARANKETQLNRRVELNLQLKQLESQVAATLTNL